MTIFGNGCHGSGEKDVYVDAGLSDSVASAAFSVEWSLVRAALVVAAVEELFSACLLVVSSALELFPPPKRLENHSPNFFGLPEVREPEPELDPLPLEPLPPLPLLPSPDPPDPLDFDEPDDCPDLLEPLLDCEMMIHMITPITASTTIASMMPRHV